MLIAINAWTFSKGTTPEQQSALAAEAGFEGVELVVDNEGPLTFDMPIERCAEIARRATDLGLKIVSLATGEFWNTNYADPSPVTRQRAVDLTLRMLDRAVALEADAILVVPAVVGKASEPKSRVSYADALHRAYDVLRELRYEAEDRGVTIAIENVWNRFLLSPIEVADFLDRINSPRVGWYFDVGNVMAFGYPDDWIAVLGGRISRVHIKDYDLGKPGAAGFCPLGEGSVDWREVIAALQRIGYDGPLTYEGEGDPADIHRRMQTLLTRENDDRKSESP